jgi:NNP family nitrate/nitrite transporter-like MFS transporter
MSLEDFRRAGHWPTLLCAFVYFAFSSVVWVLLGAMGNVLAEDFCLSPGQKGLMVAVPILGGAVLRIGMGLMTDRIGARRTALTGLAVTAVPLLMGWLWVSRFEQLLLTGLLLGVAGASFAPALPLAGRWYPPRYQGLALGIAGAGNIGTALGILLGSRLSASLGWPTVFALGLIPVAMAWTLLLFVARDAPGRPPARPLRDYAAVLKTRDAWWFCLFYSVTFGGFVGLASFLSIFFHDQYGLTPIRAGNFATLCVVAGSLVRPLGGHLADRYGGIKVLHLLYLAVAAVMGGMTFLPPLGWGTALLLTGMAALGMGNGAVFQLVPQRYPKEIGVMTGVVGAAGGIGGFLLPTLLGSLKGLSGTFAGGFFFFALAGWTCAVTLTALSQAWDQGFARRDRLTGAVIGQTVA